MSLVGHYNSVEAVLDISFFNLFPLSTVLHSVIIWLFYKGNNISLNYYTTLL